MNGKILAPKEGIEPSTHRLTADCSAIELLGNMGKVGFEPTKAGLVDLQSTPFDHFGTYPYDYSIAHYFTS